MSPVTLPNLNWTWETGTPTVPAIHKWQENVRQFTRHWIRSGSSIREWLRSYHQMRMDLLETVWNHTLSDDDQLGIEYIILGSSARGEDVFDSDLDHALLFSEARQLDTLRPQLYLFIQTMALLGTPPCQGFVMGTNERWAGTITEWQNRVESYFSYPDWENVRYLFMLLDSKVLPMAGAAHSKVSTPSPAGEQTRAAKARDASLHRTDKEWEDLRQNVHERLRKSPFLCWEMAHLGIQNTVKAPRRLSTRFGTTEGFTKGAVDGSINIKDGMLSPVLHSIRLLAVANQVFAIDTPARLQGLSQIGAIDRELRKRVDACIDYAWRIRIQMSLDQPNVNLELENPEPGHLSIPGELPLFRLAPKDRDELPLHIETARKLERMIHRQFRKPR